MSNLWEVLVGLLRPTALHYSMRGQAQASIILPARPGVKVLDNPPVDPAAFDPYSVKVKRVRRSRCLRPASGGGGHISKWIQCDRL